MANSKNSNWNVKSLVCSIPLTQEEAQTGIDRVKLAEHLIKQLPINHPGRNEWISKYGSEPCVEHVPFNYAFSGRRCTRCGLRLIEENKK